MTTTLPAFDVREIPFSRRGSWVNLSPVVGLHRTGDDIHVVANPEITVDGDRAHSRSTWIYVVRADDNSPDLCKVGHYEDELIREDGAWRFLRRFAPTDMSAT